MPVVPTYEPRVREQALEGGFQRAPDVGRGLAQAGEAMARVADEIDRIDLRDAQAKAFDAEAKITSEWLKWDAQARQKYRGQNVDGYAQAAEEWWKKAAEIYGKELDPRARSLVSKSLAEKRLQAINSVGTFVNAEKERHADETYAADVVTTIQFGVTTGDVASAAQQIREKAAVLGARKGWNTEQVQAEALKNLSNLHLAQIVKLAEVNPDAAQSYYDANKAEIKFEYQPRIEQVIKGEADNRFAAQFAASVANKPLSEQLAAAAKITDPERREKTLTQIRNNYALVKQVEQERENAAADQAWQLFAQGKHIPEAILSQMDGRERVQLQESIRTRAERLAAGRTVKTDMPTYIDLREKLASGEKVDLRAYTEKISPSDMEKLLDIQDAVKKGGAKQDSVLSDEARINNALVALGIDKKKDPESAVRLTTEIDRRVREASMAKGDKPLTPDEKQKIIDGVVMDTVYVDEWGRDPQKPLALLTPEEMQNAYVVVDGKKVPLRAVPESDRRKIIAALKATGQAVTEQNIVTLYLLGQKSK